MQNPVTSTRKFVAKHKVAIAVTATSIVWIKLMSISTKQHNDFLKEHGLLEKFYAIEEV